MVQLLAIHVFGGTIFLLTVFGQRIYRGEGLPKNNWIGHLLGCSISIMGWPLWLVSMWAKPGEGRVKLVK